MLADTADKYFIPSLIKITEYLKIPPHIAGVTILAFGNNAPDLASIIVGTLNNSTAVGVGEPVGSGMFLTNVVFGAVIMFSKRVKISRRPYLRDVLFYMGSIVYITYMFIDRTVMLYESLILFLIYLLYVTTVICGRCIRVRWIQWREKRKKVKEEAAAGTTTVVATQTTGSSTASAAQVDNNLQRSTSNAYELRDYNASPVLSGGSQHNAHNADDQYYFDDRSEFDTGSVFNLEPQQNSARKSTSSRSNSGNSLHNKSASSTTVGDASGSVPHHKRGNGSNATVGGSFMINDESVAKMNLSAAVVADIPAQDEKAVLSEINPALISSNATILMRVNALKMVSAQSNNNSNGAMSPAHKRQPSSEMSNYVSNNASTLSLPVADSEIHFSERRIWCCWHCLGCETMSTFQRIRFIIYEWSFNLVRNVTIYRADPEYYSKWFTCLIPLIAPQIMLVCINNLVWGSHGGSSSSSSSSGTNSLESSVEGFAKLFYYPIPGVVPGSFVFIGLIISIVLLIILPRERPPHWVINLILCLFGGVCMSIFWIYLIASQIVQVIESFGAVSGVSPILLTVTFLALGNNVADLISDVMLARAGYAPMAVGAIFGSALLNLLLGLGISFTFVKRSSILCYEINRDPVIVISLFFLLLSLLTSLICVPICRFKPFKLYALILWFYYVAYIALSVVATLVPVVNNVFSFNQFSGGCS